MAPQIWTILSSFPPIFCSLPRRGSTSVALLRFKEGLHVGAVLPGEHMSRCTERTGQEKATEKVTAKLAYRIRATRLQNEIAPQMF